MHHPTPDMIILALFKAGVHIPSAALKAALADAHQQMEEQNAARQAAIAATMAEHDARWDRICGKA